MKGMKVGDMVAILLPKGRGNSEWVAGKVIRVCQCDEPYIVIKNHKGMRRIHELDILNCSIAQ